MATNITGYRPSNVSNPDAKAEIERLMGDSAFLERYTSKDSVIRKSAITEMEALQQKAAQRSYTVPMEADAKAAKEKIAALMGDQNFLKRYNSNDPRERTAAVEEMNRLYFGAYGDKPNNDDEIGRGGSNEPSANAAPRSNSPSAIAAAFLSSLPAAAPQPPSNYSDAPATGPNGVPVAPWNRNLNPWNL